jgi:hypothetical protein
VAASVANAGVTPAAPRSAAAVPWKSVGAGWVLAEYSTGTFVNRGTTTLDLVSPAGAKYPMFTWTKSARPPTLIAWSPSKTEALLRVSGNAYERLNLQTRTMTAVNLWTSAKIVSYTLPTGLQLLDDDTKTTAPGAAWTESVERLTKTGQPAKVIVTVKHGTNDHTAMDPVYAPDGASIAVSAPGGVAVVSNAGGAVKKLPVQAPDLTANDGCQIARWWNSTTILAACAGQLWLVPASGAKPTPLTKSGTASNFAAWHLPSGLFVNSAGACIAMLNKQNADGSLTHLQIPGLSWPRVLTAAGPRLLLESDNTPCVGQTDPGDAVAWYNPATKAKQMLFAQGVFSILPFPNVADAANGL